MTGAEAAVGAGAAGLIAYSVLSPGAAAGVSLTAPVPAGTSVTVSVNGFDTLATLFSSNAYGNPLESRFQAQIGSDAAGYVVTAWNVTSQPLTTAAADNQVPYSGTFTIQTTVAFGAGVDLQNSIIGELYTVTNYEPIVNVSGGNAGLPVTTANVSGLGTFVSGLANGLGSLGQNSSTIVILLLAGAAALVWSQRNALGRAVA
jgi:hypothetical protein